jgi:RNA polymerase sigma-70 factor (ECF subfamily)
MHESEKSHPSLTLTPTRELVELSRAGRAEAREELFERYSARVLHMVRMRLGAKLRERLESVDIVQNVMAEAFGRLGDFEMREESSLVNWLARMVQSNICNQANYFQAAKRDVNAEVAADAREPEGGPSTPLYGKLPTPSLEVGRTEEVELIREAIASLPERYREAILLRDYAGARWQDVADEIGVDSADAARLLHSRAVSKLGEVLRGSGLE